MPLFRIRFKWKEKEYALKGRDLDMTHPYFVSLGDLIFPDSSALIIDPADDDIRREFSGVKHIMLPVQQIHLIEELSETEFPADSRVLPFPPATQESDE